MSIFSMIFMLYNHTLVTMLIPLLLPLSVVSSAVPATESLFIGMSLASEFLPTSTVEVVVPSTTRGMPVPLSRSSLLQFIKHGQQGSFVDSALQEDKKCISFFLMRTEGNKTVLLAHEAS